MIVDKAFMQRLAKEAKAHCGGTRLKFEVQTWNGHIDISEIDLEENDDVDAIDLKAGTELPDNAGEIDVAVWGVCPQYDGIDRLGNVQISIANGQLEEVWS